MGHKSIEIFWGGRMKKEEYIEKILYLNSQLCQKPDDYSKEKVKGHNNAARKLFALENVLANDIEMAKAVYRKLMESEDEFTKSNAAARCLQLKIYTDKALEIIEYRRKHGERWEAMGAERQLKIWRGEIGPDDPG